MNTLSAENRKWIVILACIPWMIIVYIYLQNIIAYCLANVDKTKFVFPAQLPPSVSGPGKRQINQPNRPKRWSFDKAEYFYLINLHRDLQFACEHARSLVGSMVRLFPCINYCSIYLARYWSWTWHSHGLFFVVVRVLYWRPCQWGALVPGLSASFGTNNQSRAETERRSEGGEL